MAAARVLQPGIEETTMSIFRKIWIALAVCGAVGIVACLPASAQQGQKPNILFIMGDDIGWMQPSI
jgi:arylsulfatase